VSEQEHRARCDRLEALREAGVDPFPAQVGPWTPIAEVRERFESLDAEALEGDPQTVTVVGRIMASRSFGKLMFLRITQSGESMQVSAKKQNLDPEIFAFIRRFDVGDFVRFEGALWRTKTDELTVDIASAQLLAKSLRGLPEKWHGLSDVEARYRQRHLDLLVNEDARRIAMIRSRTVAAMRQFLDGRGFLEVETPALQPLYGGAAARPFTTRHNTFEQELYLRISDELYLKRLVVGGLDRVYEIGHNFRNEGVSRKHNPEFTMMECYQAYADYRDMMDLVESMFNEIAIAVRGTAQIEYQGEKIDLSGSWPRVSLNQAIADETGIEVLAYADVESLGKAVRDKGLGSGKSATWATLVDDLFSEHVEPKLIAPVFITDHPVELSPLAKRSSVDPRLVERFEPFIAGMELGNAFSELNDPVDQRERLDAQAQAQAAGDEEAHPVDEDFLKVLEHGMPPTGGLGVGVDRLVMLLSDAPNIREVILFPHLRPGSP
jgi:lysyl-tRNA synthetase class 2